jgi:hypothetical protein
MGNCAAVLEVVVQYKKYNYATLEVVIQYKKYKQHWTLCCSTRNILMKHWR